jgi:hypothetical protein
VTAARAERVYVPAAVRAHVTQCSTCGGLSRVDERDGCAPDPALAGTVLRRGDAVWRLLSFAARFVREAARFRSSPDAWWFDRYLGMANGYWDSAAFVAGVPVDAWSFDAWSKRYLAACESRDEEAVAGVECELLRLAGACGPAREREVSGGAAK